MKKLISLLIVSVISLTLTGCPQDEDSKYLIDVGGANMFVDPNGRFSVIYPSDWYYFGTITGEEKRTTWHLSWAGDVTLGITDWLPNGPSILTVWDWALENRDRLIGEGYVLVQDLSPIVNANGNTGYELTMRNGEEYRIAFFFNNVNEQFDLTFYYEVGNPPAINFTQIIQSFETTDF